MKAWAQVIIAPGEFELREIDVPDPGRGQLRLRVHACGICGSDKVLALTSPPGSVLGHEVVGEVEACGPGVERWRRGDRAIPIGEELSGVGNGGFGERVLVAAEACVPVPQALPSLDAVLGEPLANGLHFVRRSRLHAGQRVAILGAGQIGLSILFWARRLGAGRIAVSEPAPSRARLAAELGADAVINPVGSADLRADVVDALGGCPQIVFEATGLPAVMDEAIDLVGRGGAAVVLAGITLEEIRIRPVALCLKETDLIFPLGTVREEVAAALEVLASGELPARRFVSHRIRQAELPAAIRDLEGAGDRIKVVVDYDVEGRCAR